MPGSPLTPKPRGGRAQGKIILRCPVRGTPLSFRWGPLRAGRPGSQALGAAASWASGWQLTVPGAAARSQARRWDRNSPATQHRVGRTPRDFSGRAHGYDGRGKGTALHRLTVTTARIFITQCYSFFFQKMQKSELSRCHFFFLPPWSNHAKKKKKKHTKNPKLTTEQLPFQISVSSSNMVYLFLLVCFSLNPSITLQCKMRDYWHLPPSSCI